MVDAAPAELADRAGERAEPSDLAVVAPLDPLVVNPGRLSILLALSSGGAGVEFVDLRRQTRLTDGNLACHARRLADGGLIGIDKRFRAGKPVTKYLLTDAGRQALQAHVDGLVSAVRAVPGAGRTPAFGIAGPRSEPALAPMVERADAESSTDDDWVD